MVERIIAFVKAIIGCKFATLVYQTDVPMSAKSGLKGRVSKIVRLSCQINYSYQKAVNNRLDAVGETAEFVAQSLPWGEWFVPNKIIAHKSEYYLRFYTYEGGNCEVVYYIDGHKANAEEIALIKSNLPKQKDYSARQAQSGLVEHQVCPKAVKVASILAIVCDGQTIGLPQTETKAE